MNANITSISAKGNITLSLGGKCLNPFIPIWTEGKPARAAAFPLSGDKPASLQVSIQFTAPIPGILKDESLILEGTYPANNNSLLLFRGDLLAGSRTAKEITFEATALFKPTHFFSIKGKEVVWQMRGTQSGTNILIPSPPLEIYWLYDSDYSLFRKGIPIEVLEEVADACKKAGLFAQPSSGEDQDIVAALVKHCFNQNPPRYDIWTGGHAFTVIKDWEQIAFLPGLYQNARRDITAVCNCFDQAAILQYYLKALGLNDVSFCYLLPYGYIKKTALVGRGTCNNPFYACRGGERILEAKDPKRSYFFAHAFCRLDRTGKILDACTGPHTGQEDPGTYLEQSLDRDYPSTWKFGPARASKIQYHRGIVATGFIPELTHLDNASQFISNFKDLVQLNQCDHPTMDPRTPQHFVACPWPNPREIPLLKKEGWELGYRELWPGSGGTMKSWQLSKNKGTEIIDIHIYVTGKSCDASMNYYISKGAHHNHPQSPLEKSNHPLGHHATYSKNGERQMKRMFWVYYNVVFDIILRNTTLKNPGELYDFYDRLARAHIHGDISSLKPNMSEAHCSNLSPNQGEWVQIAIEPYPGVCYDFCLEGKGLRLTEETESGFTFQALSPSQNKVTLAAVDNSTLLTANKDFHIQIAGS